MDWLIVRLKLFAAFQVAAFISLVHPREGAEVIADHIKACRAREKERRARQMILNPDAFLYAESDK